MDMKLQKLKFLDNSTIKVFLTWYVFSFGTSNREISVNIYLENVLATSNFFYAC